MKTAVVYWSGTGNTEAMAQEVEQGMKDAGAEAEVFEAAAFSGDKMAEYDAIAFGCPSMGDEELEDTEFAPMFEECKSGLQGKKIGLFGSYGWGDGEWMRNWEERMKNAGAILVTGAGIIANEMGVHMKMTSGPAIEKPGEMAAILNNLQENDVLFVDEIHRLNRQVEEVLYPAMEDYAIDIMIGKGATARSIRLDLPKFTLVGATTRAGLLTAPLRDRFGVVHHLEFYTEEELQTIIIHSAKLLGVKIDREGALEMARRSRGTPRLANRLLKRVRDFAQVKYDGRITKEVADFALDLLEVDRYGLDQIDRLLLTTIIQRFAGGPVGLDTLAAAVGEDAGTIEDVYEPYLIKHGFLLRTPRGRAVTELAYSHLGLEP